MSELLNILDKTAAEVHKMAAEQSVLDAPLQIGDVTVIPISKISCGFSFGGSESKGKKNEDKTTAGAGAKVTKTPLRFLAIIDGQVQVLQVEDTEGKGIIGALKPLIASLKEKKAAKKAEKEAAKDSAI